MTTLTPKQLARLELSKQGDLSFLLRKHQRPIYNQLWKILNNQIDSNSYLINCARQFGKSFTLILVAMEYCIKNPGMQVKFAIPVAENYKDMYGKSIGIIAEWLHSSIGFEHIVSEKRLIFKNGSMIKFAGTDAGNAIKLRGGASNLNIVDEAAFMRDLEDIIKDILLPMLHNTKGKTIYCSTPPKELDHYYVELYNQHLEEKLVTEFTILDKNLTEEEIIAEAKPYGGINSIQFKREFLCQFLQESELTVLPEWKDEYVQDWPRDEQFFQYYNKIEALDSGVRDNTAVLFGYYDFQAAKLIIEDEVTMNGPQMTTLWLSNDIKDKEESLGYNKVLLRIADNNNLHLIQDLSISYKLPFAPTSKTDLDAMVNKLKIWVQQGKIIVHPRCTMLTGCLKFGRWEKNKRGEMLARSKTYSHYDHLMAMVYLVRNVESIMGNPIPKTYGLHSNSMITDRFKQNNNINRASTDARKLSEALSNNRRR